MYVGFEMFDGYSMRRFCKDLEYHKGVECVICIGGVVLGGGLLASKLASLSVASLPNMPKCVQKIWSVRGNVCCNSYHIIACMSDLYGWLCLEEGLQTWLWIRYMELRLLVKMHEWVVLSLVG